MIIQQALSSHGVSEAFLDALDNLARKPSWWRDVLLRDDVFIAVRANSLNVYHRGASIFRIDDAGAGRVIPWTHTKYLIRQQQVLAQLQDNGHFEPSDIGWAQYSGPSTLSDMIRSATDLAGAEKSGLHPLIVGSSKSSTSNYRCCGQALPLMKACQMLMSIRQAPRRLTGLRTGWMSSPSRTAAASLSSFFMKLSISAILP